MYWAMVLWNGGNMKWNLCIMILYSNDSEVIDEYSDDY